MSNYVITDIEEIHSSLLANISDDYIKTVGTFSYDFLRSVGLESKELREEINILYSKLDMSNYEGEELERQVKQKRGLTRNPSVVSSGVIQVTGESSVSIGDIFETQYGVQFQVSENKVINGTADVEIKAVIGGYSGNVGANSITQIPVTLPGITEVNNLEGTSGGYDEESDVSLYERYLFDVQKPANSGNIYHYQKWAREVAGVGNSKIYPLELGKNTVEVVIVDSNGLIPEQDLIDSVQEYIDPNSSGEGMGEAPIGAYCTVNPAVKLALNITLDLYLEVGADAEVVKEEIKNTISSYLKEIVFTGKSVSYAKIGSMILDVEGVNDWSNLLLNGNASNVIIEAKKVAILESVVSNVL